jgi:hypothetical protein
LRLSADGDRLSGQARVVVLLDGSIESVHVNMENSSNGLEHPGRAAYQNFSRPVVVSFAFIEEMP